MGYTIPQNWNDEAMEYVNKLTDKINVGWDGEDYCLSDWNLRFLSRMNREVIKPPFTYQAFLDNKDIIATLEGYELDVKKFWFALLYIYDITMDFGINAADASKTDYDILVEIEDYLENHPHAVLYLSDDKVLLNNRCCCTNYLRYCSMSSACPIYEPNVVVPFHTANYYLFLGLSISADYRERRYFW